MNTKAIQDEELNQKITQACFLLNASLFALDELQSTKLFKHSLKNKIKGLSGELESLLSTPMKTAYESNPESYQKFINGLGNIAKTLSELSVFQIEEADKLVSNIKNLK